MNPYGKTIREIRLNKGMTQKEIYLGVVTRSFYAKFEKGEYDISASKFAKMLDQLAISFEEFIYIHEGYNGSLLELRDKISSLYLENKLDAIIDLYEQHKNSKVPQHRTEALRGYMLVYISYENYMRMPRDPANQYKEYLKQMKSWTLKEVEEYTHIVSRYFVFFDDQKEHYLLSEKAVSSLEKYKQFGDEQKVQHLFIRLLIEEIQYMLLNGKVEQADTFRLKIKNEIGETTNESVKMGLKSAEIMIGLYQDPKYWQEADKMIDLLEFIENKDNNSLADLIEGHKQRSQQLASI